MIIDGAPIPSDVLSRTLAALADPTRRSILEQLSLGPASVGELARPYAMSQPAVSKHVKVLEAAGLVSQEPGNRLGPRRMELGPFLKAAEWMDAYARIWETRLKHFTGRRGEHGGRSARPRRRKT
jgi:DNA-binding transcriptional ArsR family regulator